MKPPRDNSGSEFHERKYLVQSKLTGNYEFLARNFNKILCLILYSIRFISHQANFNEIFGRKMSKSLTISPENYPCPVFPNGPRTVRHFQ